jgi:ABC-type multidrug transport system ATPase subunit
VSGIVFDSVSKWFTHRPALFNWLGSERAGRTEALREVSLTLNTSQRTVLIGPNGSGKSTLLKLSCGVLLPDQGKITVDGHPTTDFRAVRSKTAFVGIAERSFIGQLTAQENLEFFGTFDDLDASFLRVEIPRVLAIVELQPFADVRVSKLSSGNLQRLSLARGLLSRPQWLVLDEPTRSLDPEATEHFWSVLQTIQAEGTSVVMSSHNIEETFALADRVIALDAGTIAMDRPRQAIHDSAELRQLYFDEVAHTP